MADLDTRDKRGSTLLVFLPFGRVLPDPNGSVGAADRAQVSYAYAGSFTADTGSGSTGSAWDRIVPILRQRRRRGGR